MIVIGALVSLLASACFNLNNLVEKRAVDRMSPISFRRPVQMGRTLVTSRLWIMGFIVGVLAVGLLVLAYSLATTIVVQSIFGAGVVLLVLASRRYIGEHLGRREHFGIAMIVLALVFVSITFGSPTTRVIADPVPSVMLISAITTVAAALVLWLLRPPSVDAGVVFGITAGLLYGVALLQTKAASAVLEIHGDLSGISWLLRSPYPYVFLVISVLGLFVFQTGLQRCRLTVLSPMTSTVASVFVVVAGSAVFHDAFPHNAALATLRLLGYGLVLFGSWVLATSTVGASAFAGVVLPGTHPDAGGDNRVVDY